MINLIDAVAGARWGITAPALEQIVAVCNRDFDPLRLAEAMHGNPAIYDVFRAGPQALLTEEGTPLEGTANVSMRGNVAILPIHGPLIPRASMFSRWSGMESVSQLGLDFGSAMRNPFVNAILLDVDSPGGDLRGISEFAETIFAARGKKPVWAFVSGYGASAAYYLAATAERVILAPQSAVGSIGVLTVITDSRAAEEKRGERTYTIVSSQSPNKRPDPATEPGRAKIQAEVDEYAAVFVSAVAKYRGVSEATVLEKFGQGGLVVGQNAVAAGMADAVGSMEGAIGEISAASDSRKSISLFQQKGAANMPDNAIQFSAEQEKVIQARVDGAVSAALTQERTRVAGIMAIAVPGYDQLKVAGIANPEATKESVAFQIVKAQSEAASNAATAIAEDGKQLAAELQGASQKPAQADKYAEARAAAEAAAKANGYKQ